MAEVAYRFTGRVKKVRAGEVDIDLGNFVVLTLDVDPDVIILVGTSVSFKVEIPTQEKTSG